jgi:hypothetical protein
MKINLIIFENKGQYAKRPTNYEIENNRFRFFYISKDKNIHIFGGCSSTYYRSNNEYDCDKHVHLSKTH